MVAFAHGRGPFRTSRKGAAGAALPTAQDNEPKGDATPMDQHRTLQLRETTDAELVEAMERVDAGVRLADPRLAAEVGIGPVERLPVGRAPLTVVPDPEPEEIDEKLIGRVAAQMSEWRDQAVRDLHHLDKNAPRAIYIEALGVVAHLDDFLDAVREHQKGQA